MCISVWRVCFVVDFGARYCQANTIFQAVYNISFPHFFGNKIYRLLCIDYFSPSVRYFLVASVNIFWLDITIISSAFDFVRVLFITIASVEFMIPLLHSSACWGEINSSFSALFICFIKSIDSSKFFFVCSSLNLALFVKNCHASSIILAIDLEISFGNLIDMTGLLPESDNINFGVSSNLIFCFAEINSTTFLTNSLMPDITKV